MKSLKVFAALIFVFSLILPVSVLPQKPAKQPEFKIEFEKFKLDNGLEVIFHIDRSDPVVAVALTAHVGSAREKEGRTGFAHLFEHLLFLESENLGKGGLDKLSARVGGSGANGSTSRDRTNYFQTVPKDALEKMLWAEADKLGWFINTVTEPVLAKEKQVVKNEKRQGVDNQPYGHAFYVIDKNLYPEDHPYNWQVIGSLDDLQNATLADVKEFFNRWYVPNNVTLVVAGDFDPAQAKKWVHKYFDEIKKGEEIKPLPKRSGKVKETVKVFHEDNFARLPDLRMVWPTVEQFHPDSYALDVLAQYLSDGKKAPLYKVIVEDKKIAPGVSMFNRSDELAGQMYLGVRAFDGKDLDDAEKAVNEALAMFEKDGISEKDLNRIKAGQETAFYNGLSSVLGKGFQLAQYNIFAGDPGFVEQDIKNILAVTTDDVMRVYKKYIKDKPFVATSFVPKGSVALALEGSKKAEVVEEAIVQGAEESFDASQQAEYKRTPSTFDRTKEPPYGEAPEVIVPEIWTDKLSNGLEIYGIENDEVPLVQFNIVIDGGVRLEDLKKVGVANLTAEMLTRGTKNKTPEELEEAIQQLGATINVSAGRESVRVSGNTLSRNYEETIALVEEILLEPRWDEKEFDLAKQSAISNIRQQMANPNAVANLQYGELLYGKNDIRSKNVLGTVESVETITLDDLKKYHSMYISPSVATMHVVGALDKASITKPLSGLAKNWKAKKVEVPVFDNPAPPKASKIYFYDVPDAKQSVLRIGYPALAATDKDFYPATITNYILGGGGFASRLTQELREGKGYTYGINSSFSGSKNDGTFTIASGVRSNVTLESVDLVKSILAEYPTTFNEKDLETTKGFLIKSNARAFETAGAKLNMLENISDYGWPRDYVKQREVIVRGMTIPKIKELASKYLDPDKMIWLVVGDAKTQLPRLKELGFGDPILLNKVEAE
ncbi:MAG: insulinase family protein [Acidobacteria bacterium]|nr:MAG: insulinase family protein [Acidobacteriota bacterium]REJ98009.1 MAG: insulinase family protein [Acidobacteriota bacterium]REK16752.1 MAG: insulinase family protein [Acidobacteriota bacterium]REK42663.1 MAG: insulinase family protein [Acidobacteriota bacterium]